MCPRPRSLAASSAPGGQPSPHPVAHPDGRGTRPSGPSSSAPRAVPSSTTGPHRALLRHGGGMVEKKKANRFSPGTSPNRHSDVLVKRVASYQSGKVESVLLPVLVSAAFASAASSTHGNGKNHASLEEDLAQLQIRDALVQGFVKREPDCPAPSIRSFERASAMTATQGNQEEQQQDNYREYAGSSGDEGDDPGLGLVQLAQGSAAKIPTNRNIVAGRKNLGAQRNNASDSFIGTMLHSLDCETCLDKACQKMKLVLGHFLSCKKFSNGNGSCQLCAQLLSIVGQHSETCDQLPCSVPMCAVIKREREYEEKVFGGMDNRAMIDGEEEDKIRVFG